MAAIFVAATRQHVGKTSSCLGIVNGMKQRLPGGGCGFIKPVGQQQRRERQAAAQAMAEAFIKAVPSMLQSFSVEPRKARALVQLLGSFDLEMYAKLRCAKQADATLAVGPFLVVPLASFRGHGMLLQSIN